MGEGYERRVGRYSAELAAELIRVARVERGQLVLDVGCGSGALTEGLAEVVGEELVAGVDRSAEEIEAARARLPGVQLRVGEAEKLPFGSASFDAVLAQLVVHLVDDARAAASEMRRVARAGAVVATCVWDFGGGMTALRTFWDSATAIAPELARERDQARSRPFTTRRDLVELWGSAGLEGIESGSIASRTRYRDFDDYWIPMTIPDGGPGHFCAELAPDAVAAIEREAFHRLGEPEGPFELEAIAWYVLGRA